jgi:diguanylate cyclase (GGDEF)-like protein
MRLRSLLLACCIALALPGLAACAVYAGAAWTELQQARAAARGAQAAGDVMRAASLLMVERGRQQEAGHPGEDPQALAVAQAAADQGLARARGALLAAGMRAEPVNLAREDLQQLRLRAALAAETQTSMLPLAEQLGGIVEGLELEVTRVERSVTFADASVGILVGLARTANQVRGVAGLRGMLLNAWLGGEALSAPQREALLLLTGRIAEGMDRLQGGLRTSGLAPTLIERIAEMESDFVREREPRYRAMVQAALAGGPPPSEAAEQRAWQVAAVASLLPAREALLHEAAEEGAAAVDAASRSLLACAAVSLISVGLVAVTVSGLLRRLAGPVQAMSGAMAALAAGDLGEPPAEPHRTPLREIGEMAASVAVFRDNFASLRRREAELGRTNVLFFAALENMSQGLTMYDADERLTVFNSRFCEVTGLAPEDVRIGMTHREVLGLAAAAGHFGGRTADEAYAESQRALGGVVELGQHDVVIGERKVARRLVPLIGGGWVTTFEDVTERRDAEARIAHMAHHDALTGLANRVLFREHMVGALARGREAGPLAVLCLDLDGFKGVNDTFGHPVGDALLRAVGRRLRGNTRDTDVVARLGGDEFAVLQPASCPPLPPAALAERLVQALREPFELGGERVEVGASVGVALAGETSTPDDLLRDADIALYQAKSAGRSTWRLFEPRPAAAVQERRRHDFRRMEPDGPPDDDRSRMEADAEASA